MSHEDLTLDFLFEKLTSKFFQFLVPINWTHLS
jgi:hypothetical protein